MVVAAAFAAMMIAGAGLQFLLLSAVFYAPATVLYVVARREQGGTIFTGFEWGVFGALLLAAMAGVHGLATGTVTI
jgi:arginine:ornithine antiporter/lysine permease